MNWRTKFLRVVRHSLNSEGKAESKTFGRLLLLFMIVGGFVGWHYFVPYWNHRTLTDFVKDASVYDAFARQRPSTESITREILAKMRELGIKFSNNSKIGERLEVVPKSQIAWAIRLRYKQVVEIPYTNPRTYWYEINYDGSAAAASGTRKV